MRELAGRTALVTGAAGGLGTYISRALARERMSLVLSGRNAEALERLRDELRATGIRAEVVIADLAKRDDVRSLIRQAEAALGPIDVLVNNAGIEVVDPFLEVTDEQVDTIVAVNLVAPMLLTRDVLPRMLERGRGHVVSIASLAGKFGVSHNVHYGATKAGVIRMMQALRGEFRDSPVGFSAVSPGFTRAGMFDRLEAADVPRTAGVGEPEKVGDAVVRAIRDDLPDVNVNPTPMAPLLAIGALAPRLFDRVAARIAPHRMMEHAAERRSSRFAERND